MTPYSIISHRVTENTERKPLKILLCELCAYVRDKKRTEKNTKMNDSSTENTEIVLCGFNKLNTDHLTHLFHATLNFSDGELFKTFQAETFDTKRCNHTCIEQCFA